jgi:hypothetical protein
MKNILFALWGAAIASGWWGIAVFGSFMLNDGAGITIVTALLTLGMIVWIICEGIKEADDE